jgi:transposase
MGRKRTQLNLSPAERREAQRLVRTSADPRVVERVGFALLGATGQLTMEELAAKVGRRRSTLQTWLAKFQAGGLAGLLERDASPGITSPLSTARVQQQLQAGLKSGRWTSAAHVAAWLKEAHGITRSRKSIYYWFEKFGLRPTATGPIPRGSAAANRPAPRR